MIHFDTISDAIQVGYNQARLHEICTYGGYSIQEVDCSGRHSYGYGFTVRAIPSMELIQVGHRILGDFGHSVTVWTDDPNQLGLPGSFREMWGPGKLDEAVQNARTAIDEQLA